MSLLIRHNPPILTRHNLHLCRPHHLAQLWSRLLLPHRWKLRRLLLARLTFGCQAIGPSASGAVGHGWEATTPIHHGRTPYGWGATGSDIGTAMFGLGDTGDSPNLEESRAAPWRPTPTVISVTQRTVSAKVATTI